MAITRTAKKIVFNVNIISIAGLGIGLLVFLLILLSISRIFYPFDTGHYEAFNLLPARHLLEGKNPYAFAVTPPYSMSPYGIVFYTLLAAGLKLFGYQLWFGRILTTLSYALCFWLVIKITGKMTRNREASLIAGLAFLAISPGQVWLGSLRPDLIGLAFALAGVYLVLDLEKNEKTELWRIPVIILLASAAFFTKQTFFLPIIFFTLRFLQISRWLEAFYFMAGSLILIIPAMYMLNYTSDGGYLWQHFTHAQTLPYSFNQSLMILLEILKSPAILILAVFLIMSAYFNYQFFSKQIGGNLGNFLRSPKLLIFSYFLVSFLWSFLSTGRVGANVNYYLESTFLMAAVSGLIYSSPGNKFLRKSGAMMLTLLILGECFNW